MKLLTFSKGGSIKEVSDRMAEISRKLKKRAGRGQAKTDDPEVAEYDNLVDEYNSLHHQLSRQTTKPRKYAEGGKVGALKTLGTLMEKYKGEAPGGPRGPAAAPAEPTHVDRYGEAVQGRQRLLDAIEDAIEGESDEPAFSDAIAMAAKIGDQNLVTAIQQIEKSYDADEATFNAALQAYTVAMANALKGPPLEKGKGGAIKAALGKLKKSARDLSDEELKSEIDSMGNQREIAGGIDRRGKVYTPPGGEGEPRRRYQDLLDESVRRKGSKVAYAKGGGVKKALGRLKKVIGSAKKVPAKKTSTSQKVPRMYRENDSVLPDDHFQVGD